MPGRPKRNRPEDREPNHNMKRYRFRLDSVLRVRRIQEERARAELLGANQAVAAAQVHLAQRIAHLEELPKPAKVASTPAFLANQARLASIASSISMARAAREVAEHAAEEKRLAWHVTAQRVEGLERLDERDRAQHALETQRAADQEVDDLVVSRFRTTRATDDDRSGSERAERRAEAWPRERRASASRVSRASSERDHGDHPAPKAPGAETS